MKRAFLVVALVAMALSWVCRASAHHSFAMYDTSKVVVLKGTVKEFEWTNPHALLWVNASAGDDGGSELWTIELPTSPGNLGRMGWTKHSLHAGDAISVEINPLREGKHGGSFKKATLASGEVLVATPKDDDGGLNAAYSGSSSVDGGPVPEPAPTSAADGGKASTKDGGCSIGPGPGRVPARSLLVWSSMLAALCFRLRRRSQTR
jgi:hypothetical protein